MIKTKRRGRMPIRFREYDQKWWWEHRTRSADWSGPFENLTQARADAENAGW